jgi:RNA polymerase sigma-70 factor (ECF subfamily)
MVERRAPQLTDCGVATLTDGFRAGDPEAVRAVYRRYAGAVHTVARSVVGSDDELCADVVQQTFVKAWRAAHTYDGDRDLAPWLYAIARRTAIDALRAERRPTRGDHEQEVDAAVLGRSFEETWEAYEIRTALDGLPPDEREVARLTHLEGLTQTEIAGRLGVPLGTVKSRAYRAHRRLAAALAHLLPAPDPGPAGTPNRSPAPVVEGREEP